MSETTPKATHHPMMTRLTKNKHDDRSHREQIESVEQPGQQHRWQDADQHSEKRDAEQSGDQFPRAERADKYVPEIARPKLFEKADCDSHLAAQSHFPEQHAAEQQPARRGDAASRARRQEGSR